MAYTDMTGVFLFKKRLDYQRLRLMGENDADNHIPSATMWEFFQAAAPTGWVKQTAVNDKVCRVVSGATGGGTGGTIALSTGLVLAHAHSVNAHTHAMPNHQHQLGYGSTPGSSEDLATTPKVGTTGSDGQPWGINIAPGITLTRRLKNQTKSDGGAGNSGSSGGTTDSQLSTLIPKYIDVIVCSKV